MERRLTARGLERRRQVMDYATVRFARHGYHPTSVAEIVQGLGVGKGVFYWYFASKEELFLEILKEAQHELRRTQRQSIGEEPDPVRRIELGIRSSLAWLDTHRDLFNLFQFASTEARFAPAMRKGGQVAAADAVRHVKDGIVEGRIRDGDPELLTNAVLGVTNQLARVFIHERGAKGSDVADAAVAFCLDGLLAERPADPGPTPT
jgi:AcrR family transcriptional regulator